MSDTILLCKAGHSCMSLESLLSRKRSAILKRWCNAILETYPSDTAHFLRSQKNRFTNPVGQTIAEETERVFDDLIRGAEALEASRFLDNIIRIRAVQEFPPSQALSFIFDLKKAVRDELAGELLDGGMAAQLEAFESSIDSLMLHAFDGYMKCREKIFEIRTEETRRMTRSLIRMANLNREVADQDSGNDNSDKTP
ncbi:MAG TPA: RsbRD N-terminal domain-containing protein [Dissulfurispiraceae bacterium]|nr:RsbRD N-terminal domain-containing protein [Dissulfurispiraceae bacterium]